MRAGCLSRVIAMLGWVFRTARLGRRSPWVLSGQKLPGLAIEEAGALRG